ncbi:hypothetical protein [Burkholderia cepacia]|uniref:hypothetical protein n=2 Tax=Burkholderia cepacia complex TaxID=87882 RepID=UPI0012D8E643|nr:hypothetical protein [Burkholderia cepacia]
MTETVRTDSRSQRWECASAEGHYAVVQVIFVVRDCVLAVPVHGVSAHQGMQKEQCRVGVGIYAKPDVPRRLAALPATRVYAFRARDLHYKSTGSSDKIDALLKFGWPASSDPKHGKRRH